MSSKEHAERLAHALESTGLVQAVLINHTTDQVKILCRVASGAEDRWTALVRRMLLVTESEEHEAHGWRSHFCRHYFLKEIKGEKKMVWGWNISIASSQMSDSLTYLIRVIKGEHTPKAEPNEVMEMELHGASRDRNAPGRRLPNGKISKKGVWSLDGDKGQVFRPSRAGED